MSINYDLPVQTKAGFPVKLITLLGRGKGCIVGYIGEAQQLHQWTSSGRLIHREFGVLYDDSLYTLENVPAPEPAQTKEVWLTICEGGNGIHVAGVYNNRPSAIQLVAAVGLNKVTLRAEFDE